MESGSLSSLDNLTHLGFRDGVDMRPTLIRVLTDLYVQKLAHSYEEKRHYTELALRLLDSVDAATRLACERIRSCCRSRRRSRPRRRLRRQRLR
jgi:hypothetical protein